MLNDCFIGIKRVVLAHEMKTTTRVLCDYRKGRSVYGVSFGVLGNAEYILSNDETLTVGEADAVFLSADAKYTVMTKGDYHHYTVNFTLSEPLESKLISEHEVTLLRGVNKKRYGELFGNLAEIWREKRFAYLMRSSSLLYLILSEFFHDLYLKNTDDFAHRRLALAKEYIDTHTTEDFDISLLAAQASMSETNFRREFVRLFGDSPIHYRDMRKLSLAKDALSAGFYTVAEAAAICGFTDASYFSRFFKKHTGMTPREYMRIF